MKDVLFALPLFSNDKSLLILLLQYTVNKLPKYRHTQNLVKIQPTLSSAELRQI